VVRSAPPTSPVRRHNAAPSWKKTMNRPTVTSAVSHGHISRQPRSSQPLSTVTSAVEPPDTSAVSHGSGDRVECSSVCLKVFQGVLQLDDQRDMQLVGGCRRVLASAVDVAQADQKQNRKGSRL
jgi:hypothetical protein